MTSALLWLTSLERTLVGKSGSVGDYDTCHDRSLHSGFLLLTGLLTGRFFSHKWLALHSAIDGIDVKAIQRARLQVSDVSVRVG